MIPHTSQTKLSIYRYLHCITNVSFLEDREVPFNEHIELCAGDLHSFKITVKETTHQICNVNIFMNNMLRQKSRHEQS